MIHVNEELRRAGWKRATNLILPEIYVAQWVDDFLEHEREIRGTRTILPPGVFCRRKAVVQFYGVNHSQAKDDLLELYDGTGKVQVKLHPFYSSGDVRDRVYAGDGRFYSVLTIYRPATGEMFLMGAEGRGPPEPERSRRVTMPIGAPA